MIKAASPRTIARMFRIGPARVYDAIRSGHVISHSLGNRSLVLVDDFEKYVRSLPPTPRRAVKEQECINGV